MHPIDEIETVDAATLSGFDAIIDVRSPGEFREDRLPGSVNLPVLSDDERAAVGFVYKQQSKFRARQIGARYISRNIAAHLESFFDERARDFRPLVYCWRGGMRSYAMARILADVGWRVTLLKGGYKTWRRTVTAGLYDETAPLPLILIDGETGAGKTDILARLAEKNAQTIDLEGAAAHRGSVFGAEESDDQPSQKVFESRLWSDLQGFDKTQPIFAEAESRRIGRCAIPPRLWASMLSAPRIVVHAHRNHRAERLLTSYPAFARDRERLAEALGRLAPFHSAERLTAWRELADAGSMRDLAHSLIEHHYDPLYRRARKRRRDAPLGEISLNALGERDDGAAADHIIAIARLKTRH